MKLCITELGASGILQVITPDKNTIIEAIRPHIYRHNFATGNLKLQIFNGITLVAESELISIASIAAGSGFFHGYVRFLINAYLKAGQPYTLKLVGQDGYVFSESAYCAWANGVDLGKYPANTTPANSWVYPLDLEIWERNI